MSKSKILIPKDSVKDLGKTKSLEGRGMIIIDEASVVCPKVEAALKELMKPNPFKYWRMS